MHNPTLWIALLLLAALWMVALPVTSARADDMAVVRDRLIAAMVPASPDAKARAIKAATARAESQQADGTWKDVGYDDARRSGWRTSDHLTHARTMAIGHRLSGDAELRDKTLKAFAWWLANDPKNSNWWHNEIGVPRLIGETALLLGDALPADVLPGIVRILRRNDWAQHTGQNLVWGCGIQVLRGLLESDQTAVAEAFSRMHTEVRVGEPQGEGIMPDRSFHQHGSLLYSGGYGRAFTSDVGQFIAVGWGTAFAAPAEPLNVFLSYLLDGQQWMIRGVAMDHSVDGREIVRPRRSSRSHPSPTLSRFGGLATELAALGAPRTDELRTFADRLAGKGEPLVGNRTFWCSDYVVHHRPDFFMSIRMFSSRTINAELVNDEGKRMRHVANGCTMLYRRGNEYEGIFPAWDWNRVPGTTAAAIDFAKNAKPRVATTANFVGAVSNGRFGAAAQEIDHDELSARKFWLMFDDGFAALGAGISSTADGTVTTSVNQCRLVGDLQRSETNVTHDGFTYVFPEGQEHQLRQGAQSGRWSDIGADVAAKPVTMDVFNLSIDHGVRPTDASYAYSVFTGADRSTEVVVLSNTPELQAVTHRRDRVTAAAFWKAGRFAVGGRTVEVDQPCLVLIEKQEQGGDSISVSNPRNTELTVTVTIDGTPHRFELPDGPMAGSSVTR
ncbi:MAG TPA: polysaccharide lyase family 8 super-sandwich domain-containing protein [Tepidisphaeraceae bacterium]|jgi:chondroitin AC lyase|nr:polysaccharide lyase family 8 super-sandwich domain-containing protein [Tepidisphaeraceae bacterium]